MISSGMKRLPTINSSHMMIVCLYWSIPPWSETLIPAMGSTIRVFETVSGGFIGDF
jgi:hypothetical protein